MEAALLAATVNGMFQLAEFGVSRADVINKLTGVPPEKYPDILDSMYAESKAARDRAIEQSP